MKILLCLLAISLAFCSAKSLYEDPEDDRIVGGKITDISLHPYQVSLRNRNILTPTTDFRHSCGGVIYDKYTIITAAHCSIARIPGQYKVVAGTNFRPKTDGVISYVKEIIFHQDYNPENFDNDVAILILSTPLPLNDFSIKAIELTDQDYPAGTMAVISGWGTTSSGGSLPYDLLDVEVPLIDRETCKNDYTNFNDITESMICAGFRGIGGKDTCQGDSGGPLVVNNKLVGIVSWGRQCALPNYPGVYANVKYLRDWIIKTSADAKARHNLI